MITKDQHRHLGVLRRLSAEECDEIADYVEASVKEKSFGEDKPNDPRIEQKVERAMLKLFGNELGKMGIPSIAVQNLAGAAKMSEELSHILGGKQIQNEITTTAMMAAVDFACVPVQEIQAGSPDLDGLT